MSDKSNLSYGNYCERLTRDQLYDLMIKNKVIGCGMHFHISKVKRPNDTYGDEYDRALNYKVRLAERGEIAFNLYDLLTNYRPGIRVALAQEGCCLEILIFDELLDA